MKFANVIGLALVFAATTARADDPPVQVMILGAYHFGNPGRDLHNMQVDDVTVPKRQAELADVAHRLERFKPTRVAVEADGDASDLKFAKYRAFTLADLGKVRNETTQIGYRIAHDMGLPEVYGIDADGDFPYDKVDAYAKQHGAGARLAAVEAQFERRVREFDAAQNTHTIGELLAQLNDPVAIRSDHANGYYKMMLIGDAKTQPGADLNAAWYARNAKIFAKLLQVAKPGDRIVVIFGAGHAYWLRHFVETMPGYQLVEPNGYLRDKKP